MNKKIKHAVAVSLAVMGLSSGFYTGINFKGIEAYAKERDSVYLKTLSLKNPHSSPYIENEKISALAPGFDVL